MEVGGRAERDCQFCHGHSCTYAVTRLMVTLEEGGHTPLAPVASPLPQ